MLGYKRLMVDYKVEESINHHNEISNMSEEYQKMMDIVANEITTKIESSNLYLRLLSLDMQEPVDIEVSDELRGSGIESIEFEHGVVYFFYTVKVVKRGYREVFSALKKEVDRIESKSETPSACVVGYTDLYERVDELDYDTYCLLDCPTKIIYESNLKIKFDTNVLPCVYFGISMSNVTLDLLYMDDIKRILYVSSITYFDGIFSYLSTKRLENLLVYVQVAEGEYTGDLLLNELDIISRLDRTAKIIFEVDLSKISKISLIKIQLLLKKLHFQGQEVYIRSV